MGSSTFHAGVQIKIDGKAGSLLRKLDDNTWQVEDDRTKRIEEYKLADLHSLYLSGKLVFVGLMSSASSRTYLPEAHATDEDWEVAKTRRLYVLAVMDLPSNGPLVKEAILNVWTKLKGPEESKEPPAVPAAVTVYRWKVRYLDAGKDIRALLPSNALKGNRSARYPEEVLAIVSEAIDTVYMTEERKTVEDTLHEATDRIIKENKLRPRSQQLPLPKRWFVKTEIERIPAFDRCAARFGRTAADKRFRAVLKHHTTFAPLQRAEIDHTPFDLIVIDDESLLPLGRPYATACIDSHTRNVLGLYISFEPPSHFTVARCLQHAFMPKTGLLQSYPEILNQWAAHGVMTELVVDNGQEFHGASFENACLSLGIEIHYTPRKKAWFKGKIERFLRTFNEAVSHGVPGTTFSNILEKEDYDSSKFAVVRWSTLKKIAYMWVADVYHQKPHRALGMPPALMWASSIRPEDIPLPDDPKNLNFILGKSEVRTLSHRGIELNGLFYNSGELTALRKRHSNSFPVDVRVDTSDLGRIIVLAPDKAEMYEVPCLNVSYATGLSLYQHRICKRFAAAFLENYSPEGWLEAKARIRQIVENEILHKKRKTRSRVARYKNMDAVNPSTAGEAVETPAVPLPLSESSAEPFALPLPNSNVAPMPESSVAPVPESNAAPPAAVSARKIAPRYRERNQT